MNLTEVIKSRRTIKKYKKEDVDLAKVKEWLQTSTYAPNHKMTEPWEIIFIGEETRAQFNHKINFGDAPVLFAVLSHKGKTTIEREENLATVASFIQNFMLLAWENGVGTFWCSVGASEKGRNLLQVSEEYDVVGVIAVGYPDDVPDVKERKDINLSISYLK